MRTGLCLWVTGLWVGWLGAGVAGPPAAAAAAADTLDLRLEGPDSVGQYQKVEFAVVGPAVQGNPFDPAAVDVSLEITGPGGEAVTVPAFYSQPYEWSLVAAGGGRGGRDWAYPSGAAGFRARFAPTVPGDYSARVRWRAAGREAESGPVRFGCRPAARPGYIRVSRRDPRYFEFGDGTPFFPVGHDLAFVGETQYVTLSRAMGIFGKMAANGANYARVWVCCDDWATGIESRKSAWGRSWDWRPPTVPAPGDAGGLAVRVGGAGPAAVQVDSSHPVAVRAGTAYALSGRVWSEGDGALALDLASKPVGQDLRGPGRWQPFAVAWSAGPDQWWLPRLDLRASGTGAVLVRDLALRASADGPNLLWEADPERPLRGSLNQPDCALVDRLLEAAAEHGIHLQLTLLTRDLYMKDMEKADSEAYAVAVRDAKRVLRYAVARWGWSPTVAAWEYWNEMNPGLPTDRAYREWGEYLREIDVNHHLRGTSAWGPAPRDYAHPELDYADLHWYLRPAWGELSKDAAAAALDRARYLREQAPARPALLGEFGLATDDWKNSPYMDQDTAWLHHHDALWASVLAGLSGTAQFWWWDHLDRAEAYGNYRGIAAFVADIPFTRAGLGPARVRTLSPRSRVVGLQGEGCAYLWVGDAQATWWRQVVDKAEPAALSGERVELGGLAAGRYRARWYGTVDGSVFREETVAVTGPVLELSVPEFRRDVAVKVTRP